MNDELGMTTGNFRSGYPDMTLRTGADQVGAALQFRHAVGSARLMNDDLQHADPFFYSSFRRSSRRRL